MPRVAPKGTQPPASSRIAQKFKNNRYFGRKPGSPPGVPGGGSTGIVPCAWGGEIVKPGSTPGGGWITPSVRSSFFPNGSCELPLRPGAVSSGTICAGAAAERF